MAKDVGVSLDALRPLFAAALRAGASETLFPEGGESRDISCEAIARLVRNIERASKAQNLGLVAATSLLEGDLGLFDLILGAAGTLREASTLVAETYGLLADTGGFELREEGATAIWRLVPDPAHPMPPMLAEFAMAGTVAIARRLADRELRATLVTFQHAEPIRSYELASFCGCSVEFDRDEIAVHFPAIYLDLPLPRRRDERRKALLASAKQLLAVKPQTTTIVTLVRRAIVDGLARGEHRLEHVARHIGLEPRTLQRRLHEMKTAYGEILDSVRREHALHAADNHRLSVAEIARRVGLADRTAFARAFRRWTGTNPRRYVRRR